MEGKRDEGLKRNPAQQLTRVHLLLVRKVSPRSVVSSRVRKLTVSSCFLQTILRFTKMFTSREPGRVGSSPFEVTKPKSPLECRYKK